MAAESAWKKQQRYSVPITTQLAVKLKAAAKDRADHAPLLLQSDGSSWGARLGELLGRQGYQRFASIDWVLSFLVMEPMKAAISDLSSSSDGMSIMSATYPLIFF